MNLQRLASDKGATDAERQTAAAMAEKLIKKFNIDQLSPEKNSGGIVSAIYCYAPRAKNPKHAPKWMAVMLGGIVDYYGVCIVQNRETNTLEFFGTRASVDAVIAHIDDVKAEAGKAWREFSKKTGARGASDREGFFIGYAFGVANMFDEAKKEAENMRSSGAALVVVDDARKKAEAAMMEKFGGNIKNRKTRKVKVGETAKAGYAAQQAARSGRGVESQKMLAE